MPPFLLPPEVMGSLDEYLATDTGGLGLERAVELGPEATIAELTRAGLRGRGGAGFPTGRKWSSVVGQEGTHRYVVVNGAEGEPGTYKDRTLLRANPYQLVEGAIIAAYAIGATEVFIALKASFEPELERVTRAVQEMQDAGICRQCEVTIVRGPADYLYGEEKALLEVIEGNAPLPRLLPPYEHGLFATTPQTGWTAHDAEPGHVGQHEANPTLVNNVETLSNVPAILARGADWFRSMGTPESPGTIVCSVSGDVEHDAVGEFDMGTSLASVIDELGGGPGAGRTVKAVLPGVAAAVITAEHLDVALSYEAFQAIGSGLGAGGFIVVDDSACMVEVARQVSTFLAVESCGQCPPCKRGTAEVTNRLERLETGVGTDADVVDIGSWLARVTDGNRCYLPVQEQVLVASILRSFPEEVAAHVEEGRCPRPRAVTIVDTGRDVPASRV